MILVRLLVEFIRYACFLCVTVQACNLEQGAEMLQREALPIHGDGHGEGGSILPLEAGANGEGEIRNNGDNNAMEKD